MPRLRLSLHGVLIVVVMLCSLGAVVWLARDVNRIETALPLTSLHKERDFSACLLDLTRLESALDLYLAAPDAGHAEGVRFGLDLAILRLSDNKTLYLGVDPEITRLQGRLDQSLMALDGVLKGAPVDMDQLRARRDELARLRQEYRILSDTVFQVSMDQVSVQREHLHALRESMTFLIALFGVGGLSLAVLLGKQKSAIARLRAQGEILQAREDTLRQSEALLLQAQRVAHMGHYVFDAATGHWTGSAALEEIFGIDAGYPRDTPGWLALVHPDERDAMDVYLRDEVLGKGQPFDREYRLVRPSDGAVRWVHGLGQLAMDASGRPSRMFGVVKDISERRAVEATLRQREWEFRSLAENLPDPVARYDRDGRRVYVNPALERDTGMSATDLIGKTLSEAPPRAFDEAGAELYARNVYQVLATGQACEWEIDWHDESGRARSFLVRAVPEFDVRGDVASVLAVARDISDRKRAEEQQRLAASVFTTSQEGIVITDAANRIVDVNEAFTRITGYTRAEALGKNPRILRSGRQPRDFYQAMWHALATTGRWRGEVWNRRKSGDLYAELLSVVAVTDESGRLRNYVGVFSDISLFKEHEAELNRIAHFDPLTGVPNRRLLADRLDQAIARARRSDRALAVCYLDLDGFKPVNDQYGHEAGDQLLITVAERLQGVLRAGDTLARLGGDEFVLLLADLSQDMECFPILDRVLDAVAVPGVIAGVEVSVTASLGVTLYPRDEADADTLLRHADQAMYLAKTGGKNRYHVFNPERD